MNKDCEEFKEWYNGHRTPKEESRIAYAKQRIESLGYSVTVIPEQKALSFPFKGNTVILYPYKGWFTGKGIKPGRGIENLLKQINQNNQ